MKLPRFSFPCCVLLVLLLFLNALGADQRHEIAFPDLPGYKTLQCDFHMHTVFSDGQVWPTVRVDEAWRLGMDAIAISDHIEYQPHKADLPTNHNRPHELAADTAKACDILLIHAAEITRATPPGHYNALFLNDVNPLVKDDFVEVVGEANKQGAFVFWNHHEWKGVENGRWSELQTSLYDKKWLHGLEIVNGQTYYPRAHQWCLDKNLTLVGNTDIHAPDLARQTTADEHRTMTLVFAKERTTASIKEALFAGRTAVWFQDKLIGRREWLAPLFEQCMRIEPPHHRSGNTLWLRIRNLGDVDIQLQRCGKLGPFRLKLPAQTVSLVKIDAEAPTEPFELNYTATNFLIAPEKGLPVTLRVPAGNFE